MIEGKRKHGADEDCGGTLDKRTAYSYCKTLPMQTEQYSESKGNFPQKRTSISINLFQAYWNWNTYMVIRRRERMKARSQAVATSTAAANGGGGSTSGGGSASLLPQSNCSSSRSASANAKEEEAR